MGVCPQCEFANPDAAPACARCGTQLLQTSESGIHVPLPSRMVEPIQPPSKPPADDRPLSGRLVSGGVAVTPSLPARSGARPSLSTLRDPPADDFPTQDGTPPGGTAPAQPGLHGYPMNNAVVPGAPQTAPVTQPAEGASPPPEVAPSGRPKLVVLRGLKINTIYPIYEGRNTIGRFADKPVDIDLVSQEAVEQIWCSRQHAVVTFDGGSVVVEDLNSLNGTWVNGNRIHAGQYRTLKHGDVLQIGTVQLKFLMG